MRKLIESSRAAAKRPVLERLRFYEGLQPIHVREVQRLVSELDPEQDQGWARDVIARVAPMEYFLRFAEDSDSFFLADVEHQVRRPLIAALVAGLQGVKGDRLHHLHHLYGLTVREPLPAHAVDACAVLASDEHPNVRAIEATIAVQHRCITPAVVRALGELLAGAITADPQQFSVEGIRASVVTDVAACGRALAPLAPAIGILLESEGRWASVALAAGELGDTALAPVLDQAMHDASDVALFLAVAHFARWRLRGEQRYLDAALSLDADSSVVQQNLRNAFRKPAPDDQLIQGLVSASVLPAWRAVAFNVLGLHGRAAAAALAGLAAPSPLGGDHDDTFDTLAFLGARWRTGLATSADLVAALQPLLADHRVWEDYVAADAADVPAWHATIQEALLAGEAHPVTYALGQVPGAASRFLPDLVRLGRDALVESLWRTLPSETFWSAVSS